MLDGSCCPGFLWAWDGCVDALDTGLRDGQAQETMSVLKAVSLAEGLGTAPDPRHARIVRNIGDQHTEIPVDLKALLQGKGKDVTMQGNDILFIPDSTGRKVALRIMEGAIQAGTGLAIYRR